MTSAAVTIDEIAAILGGHVLRDGRCLVVTSPRYLDGAVERIDAANRRAAAANQVLKIDCRPTELPPVDGFARYAPGNHLIVSIEAA